MVSKLTLNKAVRELSRDFFSSPATDPPESGQLRTAAFIRLALIVPTIFLVTFISLLDIRGSGYHPQAQDIVFFIWSLLALLYIAGNIGLCLMPDDKKNALRQLTFLSIFIELATNQLILFLGGSLISPQALFIIVVVAIYRVFLDYRFAAFSALIGGGLFVVTAFLELTGVIPLFPALPFMLAHPVYTDGFVAINIATGVMLGIMAAFFSINYGMNQVLKLQQILKDQSLLDGLTNIPNRRRFDEYIESEWKRSLRNAMPLAVILIDIDAFKPYNDHYGHGQGDDCLKNVARVFHDGLKRSADLAARYGGEEFGVILPDTDLKGGLTLAEELRRKVEELHIPHQCSPVQNNVTVSMGVAAMVPAKEISPKTIIEQADKALYRAKETGRNRVLAAQDATPPDPDRG